MQELDDAVGVTSSPVQKHFNVDILGRGVREKGRGGQTGKGWGGG